jgi:hypothetical protein
MRVDTPYGPVWLYPDTLPMKAAMQGARLDLAVARSKWVQCDAHRLRR